MCNARALGWRGKEEKDLKWGAGGASIYTLAKAKHSASVSEDHSLM